MEIGRQWAERLKIWNDYFTRFFYIPVAEVSAEYATTMEHLNLDQVQKLPMSKVTHNMRWGKKWEYGWFHWSIKVSRAVAGKEIVCLPGCGGESLIYVNGHVCGTQDKKHDYIVLSSSAVAGDVYDLYAECYAGHGVRPENGGPYAPDEIPVPEPSSQQITTQAFSWGIWDEAVYQVAMDYRTLYSLLSVLPPTSLRYQKVAKALEDFTLIADFELEEQERTASILEADKKLKDALSCTNGSTAPVMSLIGQSHLDLAWEWPLEETKRKCARTYATQLALMDKYPDYLFLACEPYIFEVLRQYYPEVYGRVREKALQGQCIGDGAFWVESDANMPSGEALIRQLVRGRRWFKKYFNQDSRMAWLPDTFGFSGALPQIFAGCGVSYFSTQKLLRADPECDPFPYNNFIWKGIDGTEIVSHIYKKNNAVITPQAVWQRWHEDRIQQENIDGMLFPFGYGDGGGGPTRDMLETVKRIGDLEGIPRTKMEAPQVFLEKITKQLEETGTQAPCYTGELYLSWHRGSYTSQGHIKRLSRKTEVALHDADYADAIDTFLYGKQSKRRELLEQQWSTLLLNQFHDILAGTSIQRVNDEACSALQEACTATNELAQNTLYHLYSDGNDRPSDVSENEQYIVVNTLSHDRNELVVHPKTEKLVEVSVPAYGYTTLSSQVATESTDQTPGVYCTMINQNGETSLKIENAYLILVFDTYGRLSSVYDKSIHTELVRSPCNDFCMYKDVTPFYDAWELSPMYNQMPLTLSEPAQISVVTTNTRYVQVKICRVIHDSTIEQLVTVRADCRRVDFDTNIDWHEKHKFLKVLFPLHIQTDEAYCETQFGYVKRPTHTSRQYDKDRYEVCNHRYTALCDSAHGVAVLNDCKYGVSVHDNCIGLSLLKAAVIPDMRADAGIHKMLYSLYVFDTPFAESGVVNEASDCNVPLQLIAVPKAFSTKYADTRFFICDNDSIVIDSIKSADDDSGAIIMRLYEAYGGCAETSVCTSLPVTTVKCIDMMEEKELCECDFNTDTKSVSLSFRPFEIKTLRWEK
ncbi:MAG: hypothetical protein K6E51_11810 [Treponema sp.]|nr:hypothetical protein [Treponema sp.]